MKNSDKRASGAAISFSRVSKRFDARPVLSNITLDIEAGEFVAIVGRSGSGKSTLLRVLCDLEEPSGGQLRVNDEQGRDRGGVRVVFQEPRLLPWKSVVENVCLGIEAKSKDAKRARRTAALDVLQSVGLRDRANEYPAVLSGGQRQRVALARALLHQPSVLLLDEPFGALDALTRIEAQRLVESLWRERRFTALLVTHDVAEAVLLADRVLLLEEGAIAASFEIDLPRPRRRDHVEVGRIVSEVLDRIFSSPDAGGAPRSSEVPETTPEELSESHAKPAHA